MSNWHHSSNRHRKKGSLRTGSLRTAHEPPVAQACLRVVDAGFCGILFIAPLFFGGRHDLGRFVFVVLSCTIALAWCCRQVALGGGKWTRSTIAYGLIAAAVAMVALQLTPLPERWLEILTPRTGQLLPLWSANSSEGSTLGNWQTISLTPSATRLALVMLLGYSLLFITAIQRLREVSDIERLLNGIALASVCMGVFGLVHYFFSNGLFFWFYQHPYRAASGQITGSFTNRNHFAHFLVLGVGPLLAWIVRRQQSQHTSKSRGMAPTPSRILSASTWLYGGVIILLMAVLLSLSRGGTLALGVALFTAILLFYRAGQVTSRTLLVACGMTLLVTGILSIYGYEKVSARLDDFTAGSLEEIDVHSGRRNIWSANVAAIQSGGIFGSGAGSHRDIYRIFLDKPYDKEYTHAENGYLQIPTENGMLGGILLICALAFLGALCFRTLRRPASSRIAASTIAVTACLVASVVHAIVDFVWFIPACMSLTLLLVACLINLSRLSRSSESSKEIRSSASVLAPLTRLRWIELACIVLVVTGWMITVFAGPAVASIYYDRYLLASKEFTLLEQRQIASQKEETVSDAQTRDAYVHSMVEQLQKVVQWHPDSARAHLRLASQHLSQFERVQQQNANAMTRGQIRDAAMASGFTSAQELREWLSRAFGPNVEHLYRAYGHTRHALRLNPLQGFAYLNLADLCFLEGKKSEDIEAYLKQSLCVRPQDCDVLFEVGRQYLLMGQQDKVSSYWTKAFRNRGKHQLRIVQWMAGRISAEDFIENFQPTWDMLGVLWRRYHKVGQEADLQNLAHYAARVAMKDSKDKPLATQTNIWLTLAGMQSHLNENDQALASLKQACRIAPSSYPARRALSKALLKGGQFHSAEPHLRWCLARRADDHSVRRDLVLANKEMLTKTR